MARRISPATFCCLLSCLLLFPVQIRAHCDGMDGPVVQGAQRALETGDVNLVLIWVQEKDSEEVRRVFAQTLAVRRLSSEAKELADRHFFETLVRLHRAGEGAPYTGLKPAGRNLGPAIPAADRALESGSAEALQRLLAGVVEAGLREHFQNALARKSFSPSDVAAGREYVRAYVEFVHYVERLYEAARLPAHGHFEEAGPHQQLLPGLGGESRGDLEAFVCDCPATGQRTPNSRIIGAGRTSPEEKLFHLENHRGYARSEGPSPRGDKRMNIKRVSPEEAKQLLDANDGYLYLDVRTPAEFDGGHVPGAKNIPVAEPDASGRMQLNPRFVQIVEKNFGRAAKIITGCKVGGRSMRAAAMLLEAGFTSVVDMRGGFEGERDEMGRLTFPGWAARGLPTTTESAPEERYETLAGKAR